MQHFCVNIYKSFKKKNLTILSQDLSFFGKFMWQQCLWLQLHIFFLNIQFEVPESHTIATIRNPIFITSTISSKIISFVNSFPRFTETTCHNNLYKILQFSYKIAHCFDFICLHYYHFIKIQDAYIVFLLQVIYMQHTTLLQGCSVET